MAHVRKSIIIHARPEKVQALALDPNRWPTWFVGMGEFEKLTGEGEVGTVGEFSYQFLGIRLPVTIEVLEYHVGPEGSRFKAKMEGPLAGEQVWTHVPKNGDTESTADIEYTVPGAALGRIANRLIIERMMEGSLEQTLENLKLLCEAD